MFASPPEWQGCITSILENPGLVVVIGSSDTGKTTFCAQLLNASVEAGLKTALVDSDMGQSEVGPPGTIGFAEVSHPVDKLSDLTARRMYFVGSITPVGNLVPTVIGAKRMVDEARSHGAKMVVVDTTGLVRGVIARKLKTHKIELLSPDHIVAIQRAGEIDPLIAAFSKIEKFAIHNIGIPSQVRVKSPELRAARRHMRFARHLENADPHVIRLDDVSCWGTWFNTGVLLPWQQVRILERALKTRVLHAEKVGRGFYIVVGAAPSPANLASLEQELETKDITIALGAAFTHLYVGLADSNANLLDVGIVQAIEFRQRYMSVISKLKSVAPVCIIQFGLMRVRPDGSEIGKIRPGEI
jgi:polynucleotide 5'-hydroxyl-kinase GRC3/NOL9